MRLYVVVGNIITCGLVTLFISYFFASGTIAENYTDKTFVAPEFFLMPVIWGIGSLLLIWLFTKIKSGKTSNIINILINFSLWVTYPCWISNINGISSVNK